MTGQNGVAYVLLLGVLAVIVGIKAPGGLWGLVTRVLTRASRH
jgi:hypothetical protein